MFSYICEARQVWEREKYGTITPWHKQGNINYSKTGYINYMLNVIVGQLELELRYACSSLIIGQRKEYA